MYLVFVFGLTVGKFTGCSSQICNKIKWLIWNVTNLYKTLKLPRLSCHVKLNLIVCSLFKIYAELYYLTNLEFRFFTNILSQNIPLQYVISHTKYKFNSADSPWTRSHTQTLLIITMTLTTAALILCHTIYWNFYKGRLSDGTTLCRTVGYVWNIVCGILYSVVNYSR